MLKSVSVFNFKVLRWLENVNLNKITLIGGKNNAGKSTLLEAIFAFMDIKNPNLFTRLLSWRELGLSYQEPDAMWLPFFSDFDFSRGIEIVAKDFNGDSRKLRIEYQNEFKPSAPIKINQNDIYADRLSNSSGFKALTFTHELNKTLDYHAHIITDTSQTYLLVEYNNFDLAYPVFFMGSSMINSNGNLELLSKLDKEDAQDKIIQPLQMFQPNIKRFQLIRDGKDDVIYIDMGNRKKIPANLLGSGFCRCLTLALLLAAGKNKILFIDEIENGIHHSFLPEFWEFLMEAVNLYDCQIIATTHSAEMIQSFANKAREKHFKDIAYVRLAKKDNTIAAHQFDYDDLSYAVSSEMEVR
jgi:AAA15 family ATPase/GTPase